MNILLIMAAGYVFLLFLISRITKGRGNNDSFYRGEKSSPWYAVGFGMVGASLSGVSFVSVPGMVTATDMTYLQMCLGFIPGYVLVACLLLPIYYKKNLTSIYSYLGDRLGLSAHRTGAAFFLLSKGTGAALRLYLVCAILQTYLFDALNLPFWVTSLTLILLIWGYTRRGGIRSIVWTDCLQTLVMLIALIVIIYEVITRMNMNAGEAVDYIKQSPMSRVFVFDNPASRQYFWKQFLSGIFIVVVMTGLDQDMMQKNLTCKTLKDSKRNMISYGLLFVPANLLFLSLGILLVGYAHMQGIVLPGKGDDILPTLCANGNLGVIAMSCFAIGIVAAAFSSADSALTSLTTCFCVDVMRRPDDEKLRRIAHPLIGVVFLSFILVFRWLNNSSIINAVYVIASYTYGPLLGLFAFSIFTKMIPRRRWVPAICIISPLICYGMDMITQHLWDYKFGYELLMINGMLTFLGLWMASVGGTRHK